MICVEQLVATTKARRFTNGVEKVIDIHFAISKEWERQYGDAPTPDLSVRSSTRWTARARAQENQMNLLEHTKSFFQKRFRVLPKLLLLR